MRPFKQTELKATRKRLNHNILKVILLHQNESDETLRIYKNYVFLFTVKYAIYERSLILCY